MNDRAQAGVIVEAVLEAWNARDLDRLTALLTEDVYWHDLGMVHPPSVGRDAVRQFSETVLRAFPDFRYEIRHPICIAEDGSRCVVPWTIVATNSGPYEPPGLAPTGRKVRFSGFDYIEFRDGLVARIETRFDPAEAIEQLLGVRLRPPAGSWRERCLVWAQRAVAWVRRRSPGMRFGLSLIAAVFLACSGQAQQPSSASIFTLEEVMVPMRDGVRLQTVILRPVGQTEPLPILLRRTPYGVPDSPPAQMPANLKELAGDGYIFVIQNLRGRFKSEGTFALSSRVDLSDSTVTNETTDAYDTIDWLVKNVSGNNGRVGLFGVSYDGLTAALALLHPHPALKAISEQASPVDQWMNDDMHRYGALRESYAVEYSVMEQSDKNRNTNFAFETYDTYSWYLALGPLSNVNGRYLHGAIPFWDSIVAHPDYDGFWKREAWVSQLHASTVPNLNVAGFFDQEDPWGPWQIFRHAAEQDPDRTNFMVAGPWYHGQWSAPRGDSIGLIALGGHETAREFRENLEAPFFRYYLHDRGEKATWRVTTFQSGSNRWRSYAAWPPANSRPVNLYLHADGSLSFDAPGAGQGPGYREYVSDPANPVPYRQRPVSPTYPGGDWRTWEVADQRFVDGRPDVLTFTSAPLDHDLTITGEVAADLFASTSGTDADFVVKLIDVYPEDAQPNAWNPGSGPRPGEYARSVNGYELPIAMEVRRGRYNASYEHPAPLAPDAPVEWKIPLRDRDHVFLKGHRLMVQVQSTWFPIIDRNPQRFVPSIYRASAADYVKATQRVYCTPRLASHIVLPVVR